VTPEDIRINYGEESISFSGRFKEAVFEKNLIKFYFNESFTGSIKEWLDPGNDYNLNNYGYRGPDFRGGIDLVTAGCSVTYGIGVPENGTWPSITAKKLKLSYINLSKPGASIEWVVNSLFSYFSEFGNPKNVFVLFPGLLRKELVLNCNYNTSKYVDMKDFMHQGMNDDSTKGVVSYSFVTSDLGNKSVLLKRPFPVEETIPIEDPIYRSFRAIRMLEIYCKSSNINLVWGSWSDDLANLMKSIPRKYYSPEYLEISGLTDWSSHYRECPPTEEDPEGIIDKKLNHTRGSIKRNNCMAETTKTNCICYVDCHEALGRKFPESFHVGTDRHVYGKKNAHMGVHRHAHISTDFVRRYREKTK
jgi:hypothetical protein